MKSRYSESDGLNRAVVGHSQRVNLSRHFFLIQQRLQGVRNLIHHLARDWNFPIEQRDAGMQLVEELLTAEPDHIVEIDRDKSLGVQDRQLEFGALGIGL